MNLDKCRYIVVEGPIGAGKTSLAHALAQHLDADVLLEQPGRESVPRALLRRHGALRAADAAHVPVPARRPAARARAARPVRASRRSPTSCSTRTRCSRGSTLSDDEFALYEKIFLHLKPQVPVPDLVVYLQAPVDTLVSRVHRRGVEFERQMPEAYLARLADAYARFFYSVRGGAAARSSTASGSTSSTTPTTSRCSSRASRRCAANGSSSTLVSTPDAKPYGTPTPVPAAPSRVTVTTLAKMAAEGQRIAMLTAYDASFAALAERAGVDVLLVGDSLGMVVQGHRTTLPVTLDDIVYHTRCVVAGCSRPLVIADLPFGTFQGAREDAFRASVAALQAGAQMVKLEGGAWIAATVEYLTARGVPVCGHVGLTPQSVNVLGGYKVQGRTDAAADALIGDAQALARAGASLVVVECVPAVSAPASRGKPACR